MGRFKFLFVIGIITIIMNITGGATISTTASLEIERLQQDNIVLNDIVETKGDSQLEEEISGQKAEIIFNEWGYTYSIAENSNSSIKEVDNNNILNEESGYEGETEEKVEIILQWSDAQKSLEEEKLCWLNNEFLKSFADDISFIVSDSDVVIAKYSTQTSKVEVYVFTVSEDDSEYFEFGRNYTSELYNIHQIGEEKMWQCFSYNGYDGTQYTSAVFANKNIVCEIKFENCDKQFICNTLAVY